MNKSYILSKKRTSIPRKIIKNTISLTMYISKTDKVGLIILIASQLLLIFSIVAYKFTTNPNLALPLPYEILEIAITGITDGIIISMNIKPWKKWKKSENKIANNIANKHIKL